MDLGETASVFAGVRAVAGECERRAPLGDVENTTTPRPPLDLSTVERFAELGVHRLLVQPSELDGDAVDRLIDDLGHRLTPVR